MSMKNKTLAKGLSKTRRLSPSISLQTIIERAKQSDFAVYKKLAGISDEEAMDAAKVVSTPTAKRLKRYSTGATIGAVTAPVIRMAGDVAESAAAGGGRRGIVAAAGKALARPSLAKEVVRGIGTGAGVQAVREGVETRQAKKTVNTFLREQGSSLPYPQNR